MIRHDSWLVLGVLGVLVLATVAPFALPLLPANPVQSRCLGPSEVADRYGAEFRRFHARNLTGDGVVVAVVDPQGFAVETPGLAERVVATRSFWPGHDVTNGGRNQHGTASAAIVAAIAPDAELYLANFDGSDGFVEAIDWAIRNDVDVIVAPAEFYGKPNDGTAPVSTAVTNATERGISVVPAGNLARNHWEGTYTGDGWLAFAEGDDRLYLRGDRRRIRVWLRWNETTTGASPRDFDLVLYEELGNVRRVAASRDYPDDNVPTNELLATTVGGGTYYLRVRGSADTPHHVELFAPTHELVGAKPNGSIVAPATAKRVIAIGATRRQSSEVLPTSSRGPTNDGRLGVDLVAPGEVASVGCHGSFAGSSVAASYVAGVVALMKAKQPSLSPAEIEATLKNTANDSGAPGVDAATGYGRIDVGAAIDGTPPETTLEPD